MQLNFLVIVTLKYNLILIKRRKYSISNLYHCDFWEWTSLVSSIPSHFHWFPLCPLRFSEEQFVRLQCKWDASPSRFLFSPVHPKIWCENGCSKISKRRPVFPDSGISDLQGQKSFRAPSFLYILLEKILIKIFWKARNKNFLDCVLVRFDTRKEYLDTNCVIPTAVKNTRNKQSPWEQRFSDTDFLDMIEKSGCAMFFRGTNSFH